MLSGSTAAADVSPVPVPAEPDPRLDRRRHRPGLRQRRAPGRPAGTRASPAGRARRRPAASTGTPIAGCPASNAVVYARAARSSCRTIDRAARPARDPPQADRRGGEHGRARRRRRRPRRSRATCCRRCWSASGRAGTSAPTATAAASSPTTTAAQRSERGASVRGRSGRAAPTAAAAAPKSRSERRRRRLRLPLRACSVTTARLRGRAVRPSAFLPRKSALAWLAWRSCVRSWWSIPAATSTTAKMRDVLVGALASELKLDVVETTHRGHAPRARRPGGRRRHRPRRGRRRRRHRERGRQRPAGERPRAAPADARRRPRRLHQRLLPRARPLPGPGRGDRGDPRLAPGRTHPAGLARHRQRARAPTDADADAAGRRRAGSSSPPGSASTPRSSPGSRPSARRDGGPPAPSTSGRPPAPSCWAASAAGRR